MNVFETIYRQILGEMNQARHVMMVMHRGPDGDTAGACLALAHYLDTIDTPHTCFCVDELPETYRFLPGRKKITTDKKVWNPEEAKFDLLIVLDSGDLKYAGIADYVDRLTHEFKIINIDHHGTNPGYGYHNLVVTEASSTCEIVHELLDSVDVLNKNMATCLMTGLITDTGGFTNLATTASAIRTASKLLQRGVNINKITANTVKHHPVEDLKLWGRALERLTRTKGGLVITVITQKDLEECGVGEDAINGVANFLNSLDEQSDAKAVLVLSERSDGIVKGSLRTTNPLMDVSKIATLFGGGGHTKAAGFSVPGRITNTNGQWLIETAK
ncbi:MAG: bifunctional oligoribonuclease/PAP phosphatase NrnA [Candidatus Kerfeldbacteria bacterium]